MSLDAREIQSSELKSAPLVQIPSSVLRLGLKNLANWAVGPAAAHDEEDDGEQCCKKKGPS